MMPDSRTTNVFIVFEKYLVYEFQHTNSLQDKQTELGRKKLFREQKKTK